MAKQNDMMQTILRRFGNIAQTATGEDMVRMMCEKIKEEYENMGHVNILVAGKTGVGKTSLINAIFGKKMGKTGVGKPITHDIREYTTRDYPVTLYDTVGLELSAAQQETVRRDILKLIEDKLATQDMNQYIHCIWYCINANSNRIEEEEIRFITEIGKQTEVPVLLILTQSYGMNAVQMEQYIERLNLPVKRIFRVLASDYQVDETYTKRAFGCEDLVEYVVEILPEAAQKAFVNAQIASLKPKRQKAQAVIAVAVTAAFGEGFLPLPFADAAALVPTQIAMISKITAVYGVELKKASMTAIITGLLGTTGATIAGRTIATNLLKLIPGVGTTAGGAISGGTAAVLTVALGETYCGIMEALLKGELTEEQLKQRKNWEQYTQMFKDKLRQSPPPEASVQDTLPE